MEQRYTSPSTTTIAVDQNNLNNNNREKNRRPVRAKRCNRRTFGEDRRPVKRLFTPEIKRFLKDWLVRRRDNPYPNRDEKKSLSIQTGLTYIQVCNWFANWRRKLKNAGKEPQRKTWGNLIKSYNSQAHGNVEHFSICSEDSIWEEMDTLEMDQNIKNLSGKDHVRDHSYISQTDQDVTEIPEYADNNNEEDEEEEEGEDSQHQNQPQCFYVTSTTEAESVEQLNSLSLSGGNKYKNHIMEKYLRDCQKPLLTDIEEETASKETASPKGKPPILSKWLESAAKFRPSQNNYLNWTFANGEKKDRKQPNATKTHHQNAPNSNKKFLCNDEKNISGIIVTTHGREELDAAEALTRLATSNLHSIKL